MSNSLKDQLLGLGFKPAPKPERKPEASVRPSPKAVQPKTTDRIRHGGKPKPRQTREEIDLARAFALRTQHEKRERDAAEQAKQMAAQQKKAAKEQVGKLLDGGILNAADAEIAALRASVQEQEHQLKQLHQALTSAGAAPPSVAAQPSSTEAMQAQKEQYMSARDQDVWCEQQRSIR